MRQKSQKSPRSCCARVRGTVEGDGVHGGVLVVQVQRSLAWRWHWHDDGGGHGPLAAPESASAVDTYEGPSVSVLQPWRPLW